MLLQILKEALTMPHFNKVKNDKKAFEGKLKLVIEKSCPIFVS